MTVSHTALYKGRMSDNGKNISCTVVQLHSDGRTILFSSTVHIQLRVMTPVVLSSTLPGKIGIISGILLAIIFIVIIFIIISLVIVRRRKKGQPKYSKYDPVDNKNKDEILNPIWRSKARQLAAVSQESSFEKNYSEKQRTFGLCSSNGYNLVGDKDRDSDRSSLILYQEDHPEIPPGDSLSRPTTRTTKTISSASNSSRSSFEVARSTRGELVYLSLIESPEGNNCSRVQSDTLQTYETQSVMEQSSLHETHFGDSQSDLPRTVIYEQGATPGLTNSGLVGPDSDIAVGKVRPGNDSPLTEGTKNRRFLVPKMERLKRQSDSKITRVEHEPPRQSALFPLVNFRQPGMTVFDCEQGCFVTQEEFNKMRKLRQDVINEMKHTRIMSVIEDSEEE